MNRPIVWIVPAVILIAAVAILIYVQTHKKPPGTPNFQIVIRHPDQESNLTEIDVVNNGNGPGAEDITIDAEWADADLVDAKALTGFDYTETGRRGARFQAQDSTKSQMLDPGGHVALGWLKLTDQSTVHADFAQ